MPDYNNDHDLLIALHTEVKGLRQDVQNFNTNFITRAEFEPVRMIVYGIVAVVLLGVIGAIVALVLK